MGKRIPSPSPSPWSDLPNELLDKIAKRLESDTDLRRFRAVCSSWRSTTTMPHKKFPFKLPLPITPALISHPQYSAAHLNLTERTVYLLQLPEQIEENEKNCWIVKTLTQKDGKIRILNPVSDLQIKVQSETLLPKVLNTLNFRVFEIFRAYTLEYVNSSKNRYIDFMCNSSWKKVAVSPFFDSDDFAVMAIDKNDQLWYIKCGDENWTMAGPDDDDNAYSDVVNYKGQFYGIRLGGSSWVFDSSFKATKTAHYVWRPASKRHLVELCDGELCLVEEVTDQDKRVCTCYDIDDGCTCVFPRTPVRNTNVEIIISRIDKTLKEWVEVKKLDDQVIFVGDDCSFSVSAEQIKGLNGTRVFYTDRYIFFRTEEEKKPDKHHSYDSYYDDGSDDDYNYFECDCGGSSDSEARRVDSFVPNDCVKLMFRGMHGHNTGVCDFETGKLGSLLMFPEYADIFWPPPSWLNSV